MTQSGLRIDTNKQFDTNERSRRLVGCPCSPPLEPLGVGGGKGLFLQMACIDLGVPLIGDLKPLSHQAQHLS